MTDREEFERFLGNEYYDVRERALLYTAWRAARRWIPVSERLPEADKPVIAFGKNEYGKNRVIRASYAPAYTLEDEFDLCEGDADYDENEDKFYVPEGWYEHNDNEDTHWMVTYIITHWQPLPPLPEEE